MVQRIFLRRPFLGCSRGRFMLCTILLCLISSWPATTAHGDCGQAEPTKEMRKAAQDAEIEMFGKPVSEMSADDFSVVHADSLNPSGASTPRDPVVQSDGIVTGGLTLLFLWKILDVLSNMFAYNRASASDVTGSFQLVDVPIVYHVMPRHDAGLPGTPALTDQQKNFTTDMTNRLYNIYDRANSRTSSQFIHFVNNDATIYHDTIEFSGSCEDLNKKRRIMHDIVSASGPEWEFKMHVIVCECQSISGLATFPDSTSVTSPYHNAAIIDYRALACEDDDGNRLCEKDQQAKWWRSRSTVVAHEFGHSFGLSHTFEGGCDGGDDVADTPAQDSREAIGCPGLLPYDKDRNVFSMAHSSFRSGVLGNCNAQACCVPTEGQGKSCPLYHTDKQAILQNETNHPGCCSDHTPIDSCGTHEGVDPANNVMSYSPDFCMYELTTGQMARMTALIRKYKSYMYCNYATVLDTVRCYNIPCASTATSPNCVSSASPSAGPTSSSIRPSGSPTSSEMPSSGSGMEAYKLAAMPETPGASTFPSDGPSLTPFASTSPSDGPSLTPFAWNKEATIDTDLP